MDSGAARLERRGATGKQRLSGVATKEFRRRDLLLDVKLMVAVFCSTPEEAPSMTSYAITVGEIEHYADAPNTVLTVEAT